MAEEPQPSTIQEGDQASLATPSSAEDRKAAASLSNLDAKADGDTTIRQADTEALGKAMKNLDVRGDTQAGASRKVVKVDAADVNLLAEQLDISKVKAMDLLKLHEADAVKAVTAWITTT